MKKILLLLAVVGAVWALSLTSDSQRDVGELLPIQTLVVTGESGNLRLLGDGDLVGTGETWEAAMCDLEQSAAGKAFFGCTGHVVFSQTAMSALAEALEDSRLRPAARLYLAKGDIFPDQATVYLTAHSGDKTIQSITTDALAGRSVTLPMLCSQEGRLLLLP